MNNIQYNNVKSLLQRIPDVILVQYKFTPYIYMYICTMKNKSLKVIST